MKVNLVPAEGGEEGGGAGPGVEGGMVSAAHRAEANTNARVLSIMVSRDR